MSSQVSQVSQVSQTTGIFRAKLYGKYKKVSKIIHGQPVISPKTISFKDETTQCQCQYKNKFGENQCNKNTVKSNFCKSHNTELKKHISIIKNLQETFFNLTSQKSKFKLFVNLYRYILKHKEIFVNYNLGKLYDSLFEIYKYNLNDYVEGKRKNVNLLLNIDIESVDVKKQIETNRKLLVSNSIKLQKLSEIYIKQNDILPVFCKGIDSKIMSFIV